MTHYQDTLNQLHQNLNTLRERESKYGGNAPLELLHQISDHQQAISLTEQRLAGQLSEAEWREAMKPLLVHLRDREASPPRDKNLTILLNNVRKIWVDDFLNSALLNAIYIDLELQEKPDAVPQPFEELNIRLRSPEQAEQDLPAGTRALDVYQQAQGSLLILGQPGAGKTTLLATLTRELLTEAENNPTAPVPVIFNLILARRALPFQSDGLSLAQ
jgi:DNA replication protein DnaC